MSCDCLLSVIVAFPDNTNLLAVISMEDLLELLHLLITNTKLKLTLNYF